MALVASFSFALGACSLPTAPEPVDAPGSTAREAVVGSDAVVADSADTCPAAEHIATIPELRGCILNRSGRADAIVEPDPREPVEVDPRGGRVLCGATGISVRGVRALESQPLIYIDGGSVGQEALDHLSPHDIESIEVIKSPTAATLYGEAATQGVILITTKRDTA